MKTCQSCPLKGMMPEIRNRSTRENLDFVGHILGHLMTLKLTPTARREIAAANNALVKAFVNL